MKTVDATVNEIFAPSPELYAGAPPQIAAALLELINEEPQGAELIRGRTFARVLH